MHTSLHLKIHDPDPELWEMLTRAITPETGDSTSWVNLMSNDGKVDITVFAPRPTASVQPLVEEMRA